MIRALLLLFVGELRMQLRQPLSLALLIGLPIFLALGTVALASGLGGSGAFGLIQEGAGLEPSGPMAGGESEAAQPTLIEVHLPESWSARLPADRFSPVPLEQADAVLFFDDEGALRIRHEVSFAGLRAFSALEGAVQRELDRERADRLGQAGLARPLEELVRIDVVDRATESDRSGATVGTVLPGMLMFALLLAGLVTALDLFTGEKERGTIETLLTTGVDRRAVAVAKLGTVAAATWVAGALFIVALAGFQRLLGADAVGGPVGPGVIAVMLVAAVLLGVQVAGVAAMLGIYADDYKTASMLSAPVMLVLLAPASASVAPVPLDPLLALVPIANVSLATREFLGGVLTPGLAILVAAAALAHSGLAAVAVWRLMERETALIGAGSVGRGGARYRGGQALAVYAIAFVGLWFFGQTAQRLDLVGGMVFTQLLLAAIGLGAIAWLGLPMVSTLSLRLPRPRDLGLAAVAGLCAPGLALLVLELQSTVMPAPSSLAEAMAGISLDDQALWIPLLVFALLPGLCEETLFRGALLGLQRTGRSPAAALVLNALAFGLFHVAVHRWLPTAALGLLIAIAVWKTRSLWIGVLMHTLNNGIAITLSRVGEPSSEPGPDPTGLDPTGLGLALLATAIAGAAVTAMGRGTAGSEPPSHAA